MPSRISRWSTDTWMTAPLAVRVRFRGQGRLRRLLWAVGGRRRRRPAELPGGACDRRRAPTRAAAARLRTVRSRPGARPHPRGDRCTRAPLDAGERRAPQPSAARGCASRSSRTTAAESSVSPSRPASASTCGTRPRSSSRRAQPSRWLAGSTPDRPGQWSGWRVTSTRSRRTSGVRARSGACRGTRRTRRCRSSRPSSSRPGTSVHASRPCTTSAGSPGRTQAYELDAIPTMLQLRRNLRRSIRRGLVVLAIEDAGRIVAASRVGVRTPSIHLLDGFDRAPGVSAARLLVGAHRRHERGLLRTWVWGSSAPPRRRACSPTSCSCRW